MLKKYYRLTKPGIIYGNLLTAIGGFLFAAGRDIDIGLLLATAAGTSLVIASGCVFNNYIDRSIDAKMKRTKERALVNGDVSEHSALIYGTILGVLGFVTLAVLTNLVTVILGAIGFISYVFVYTYLKRKTVYGTLVGSIPGATPIAAGYTAVTGQFDLTALILFLILVAWQMPHFYAIAMFRRTDYAAAGIPVLAVVKGMFVSKIHIIIYMVLFAVSIFMLFAYGNAGYAFLIVMGILSLRWLWLGASGYKQSANDEKWARKIFGHSLLIILALSIMLALDPWLP